MYEDGWDGLIGGPAWGVEVYLVVGVEGRRNLLLIREGAASWCCCCRRAVGGRGGEWGLWVP